jgi:hypothetical protein
VTVLYATTAEKVLLALRAGRSAEAFLDAERDRLIAAMREITATRRGASRQVSLLADYHLFHIEADLRWIDHAAGRLGAPAEEIRL